MQSPLCVNKSVAERTDGFCLNAEPLLGSDLRGLNMSEPKNAETESQGETKNHGLGEEVK